MILYSVLVSLIILMTIAFKGPMELYFLKTVGFNFAESIDASIKAKEGMEVAIKGGILATVIIVQPIIFSIFFLRIIRYIFNATAVKKAIASGHVNINTRNSPPPSSDHQHMYSHTSRDVPSIMSSLGNAASASIEEIFSNSRPHKYEIIDKIITRVHFFRGSRLHLIVTLVIFCFVPIIQYFSDIHNVFYCNILLILPFLPSFILYNYYTAFYADVFYISKMDYLAKHTIFYDMYKKFYWNSSRAFMSIHERLLYKVKACFMYIVSYFLCWVVFFDQESYKSYINEINISENIIFQFGISKIATEIEKKVDVREGEFYLKSNPFIYKIFNKGLLLKKLLSMSMIA